MGFHALTSCSKSFFTSRTHFHSFSPDRRRASTTARTLHLSHRSNSFRVFASQQEPPNLNSQDLMELKFGRLLGEDPKLTLAKIMGRKVNPDATFLDIEKAYHKRKGKLVEVEEVPFEGSKERNSLSKAGDIRKSTVPNVILRKPTVYKGDDDEDLSSTLRMRPNLSLQMRDGQVKEKFSDMTLLRKPEPAIAKNALINRESSTGAENQSNNGSELEMRKDDSSGKVGNLMLFEQPRKPDGKKEYEQFADTEAIIQNDGLEQDTGRRIEFHQELSDSSKMIDLSSVDSIVELSVEAALQGKPIRLDQYAKQTSNFDGEETSLMNPGGDISNDELGNSVEMSDLQESEDADWTRAEDLLRTGDRVDVEILSCNSKGFIVSFGSLVGILPQRNLASKWKFIAFESWLRQKGLDPSIYRKNIGTTSTSYDAENKNLSPDSHPYSESDGTAEGTLSQDMKMEDLLMTYDQEKIKFLSSFIGQKIRANVLLADRKTKKLIFSLRHKEKEEQLEKRRNLMARLQVGDIVKCRIQKITYFGIFVEVEGVSALIHQSELSWDATLNPASYFKIGQVIEAKVLQLNFALERIFLSLKEITPDPLLDSLESVVGDRDQLDGRLEAAETDEEWPEVEALVRELQRIEGVQSVSKGRFFRSPGLAPTFQVYMASIFENQYKLLARSGNRIQEVIVQTSLDKEMMKSVILTCANRVE